MLPMNNGPDYDNSKIKRWKKNIEEARDNPLKRKEAVINFANKVGLSPDVLWYNFCTDDLSPLHYAIDPTKQTLHQSVAAEWIESLPMVLNFKTLPGDGPDALFVSGGYLMRADQLANADIPKSIDFYWETVDSDGVILKFYAAHKYTKEDGGAQENQFRDLLSFALESSKLKKERGIRILSLSDGPFYQKTRRKTNSGNRLSELKEALNGSQFAAAMETKDLPDYLTALPCSKLLTH